MTIGLDYCRYFFLFSSFKGGWLRPCVSSPNPLSPTVTVGTTSTSFLTLRLPIGFGQWGTPEGDWRRMTSGTSFLTPQTGWVLRAQVTVCLQETSPQNCLFLDSWNCPLPQGGNSSTVRSLGHIVS